jgi:hypothetical protein
MWRLQPQPARPPAPHLTSPHLTRPPAPQAEEAYLRARLAAGLPPAGPLRAAGHKYLAAALANPSWTFAKRLALVDRCVELSAYLAKVPAKAKGSPYSAVLSGRVPLVPRLSREKKTSGRSAQYTPPPQFAAGGAAAPPALAE